MFDSKAKQRQNLSESRMILSTSEVQDFSTNISERALELAKDRSAKRVHVYLPIEKNNEVDTWMLAKGLLSNGLEVYTSIFGESRSLRHVMLQSDTVYDYDELGIPKPTKNYTQKDSQYDLVFAPLLGFDEKLNRLGYGRGVYDTFLSDQKSAFKVGLAYEVQKVRRIKTERHDVKLNAVITDAKLYN